MVKVIATWKSSPILADVLEWDDIIDMLYTRSSGLWLNPMCESKEWLKSAKKIEYFSTTMMLGILNGIRVFVEAQDPVDTSIVNLLTRLETTLKNDPAEQSVVDDPEREDYIRSLKYIKRENRMHVHLQFAALWEVLVKVYFHGYRNGLDTTFENEFTAGQEPYVQENVFEVVSNVRAALDSIRTVQTSYFKSKGARRGANNLRDLGKVVAMAGSISALAGGAFGLGPAIGYLGNRGLSKMAEYLEPNAGDHEFRINLMAKIDFILNGETKTDLLTPKTSCTFHLDEKKEKMKMDYVVPEDQEPLHKGMSPTHTTQTLYLSDYSEDPAGFKEVLNAIRDTGLCSPVTQRFERVRFAFSFLNLIRQCHHGVTHSDAVSGLRHRTKLQMSTQKDYSDTGGSYDRLSCQAVCEDYGEVCYTDRDRTSDKGQSVHDWLKSHLNFGCGQKRGSSLAPTEDKYISSNPACPMYVESGSEKHHCKWLKATGGPQDIAFNCRAAPPLNHRRICPCYTPENLFSDIGEKKYYWGELEKKTGAFENQQVRQLFKDEGGDWRMKFPRGISKGLTHIDPWVKALWKEENTRKTVTGKLQELLRLVQKITDIFQRTLGDDTSQSMAWLDFYSDLGGTIYGTPGAFTKGVSFAGPGDADGLGLGAL